MSDESPGVSRVVGPLLFGAGLVALGMHGLLAAAMLQDSAVFALLLLAPGLVVLAALIGAARKARTSSRAALGGALIGMLHGLLAGTAFGLLGLTFSGSSGGWAGGIDIDEVALFLFALAGASVIEVAASGTAGVMLARLAWPRRARAVSEVPRPGAR
jgi:hypothetical protein